MQTPTVENPTGLDGFEFVEFTSPDPEALAEVFERLGFSAHAQHPTRAITLYRQGDINLLLNREPQGPAADFRVAHGPSASAMACVTTSSVAVLTSCPPRPGSCRRPSRPWSPRAC